MNYTQRLCALLPEYDARLVSKARDLLRQGVAPREIAAALGHAFDSDYKRIGYEVLSVAWFLVMSDFGEPLPEPLQIIEQGDGFTLRLDGREMRLSREDALYLLVELYHYRFAGHALEQ